MAGRGLVWVACQCLARASMSASICSPVGRSSIQRVCIRCCRNVSSFQARSCPRWPKSSSSTSAGWSKWMPAARIHCSAWAICLFPVAAGVDGLVFAAAGFAFDVDGEDSPERADRSCLVAATDLFDRGDNATCGSVPVHLQDSAARARRRAGHRISRRRRHGSCPSCFARSNPSPPFLWRSSRMEEEEANEQTEPNPKNGSLVSLPPPPARFAAHAPLQARDVAEASPCIPVSAHG